MGGMANFIAGAAGTGADLFAKQSLDDMRLAAEIEKEKRIGEIKLAQQETQRQQAAGRVKNYFAPVTSSSDVTDSGPGDADSDTTALNVNRPATNREAIAAALQAGDLPAGTAIESMQHKDDIIAAQQRAAELRLQGVGMTAESRQGAATTRAGSVVEAAKIRAASGEKIAGLRWLNIDGSPKETSSLAKEDLRMVQHDINANNTQIRDVQKQLNDILGPNVGGLRGENKLKRIADLNASLTMLQSVNSQLHESFGAKFKDYSRPRGMVGGADNSDPAADILYGDDAVDTSSPSQMPPGLYDTPPPAKAAAAFLNSLGK